MTQCKFPVYLLVAASFLSSCGNDDDAPVPFPPTPQEEVGRTVLVYQVANRNGLSGNSISDINEMRQAAAAGDIGSDGRLIVYNHRNNTSPMLLEIKAGAVDTLKVYDTAVSSASSARMAEVLDDMASYSPAREYGLILWGHGTGWLQDGREDISPMQRSYGGDNGQWMNVSTLSRVLSEGPALSFLYFDCCFMASVEVAYELGSIVPRVASSVMEIAAEGMPYHMSVKHFFSKDDGYLSDAAAATFDYYSEWQRAGSRPECSPSTFSRRYCAMTVYRTDGIAALAEATRRIYSRSATPYPAGMKPMAYGRGTHAANYFDFGLYVHDLCIDSEGNERYSGAAADLAAWNDCLDAIIEYKADIGYVFGSTLAVSNHSGLSTYIFSGTEDLATKNYNTLRWYADIASALL
ncbi:MAG: hypothetical protein K2L75_05035 [Muribaculaceae bacterium]|nr:hypothetical protein [Muribaculaceae bacterium]